MDNKLTIGQAARATGLPAKTIRYYEEAGIFKPVKRQDNKYRTFSNKDIRRLRLIKETRSLGIPLKEIKEIVAKCTEQSCRDAEAYMENQLPQYIASIDKKIEELKGLKKQLTFIKDNFKKVSLKNHALYESTRDLMVGVSSLDRTSSDFGKPTTSQSGFYRDKKIAVTK